MRQKKWILCLPGGHFFGHPDFRKQTFFFAWPHVQNGNTSNIDIGNQKALIIDKSLISRREKVLPIL